MANKFLTIWFCMPQHGTFGVDFVISSPGLHLAHNACGAAAVAISVGVSLSQIGTSLSSFTTVHMRSELEVLNTGIRIINDAYKLQCQSS